jgi:hypothetical protein
VRDDPRDALVLAAFRAARGMTARAARASKDFRQFRWQ